MVPHVGPPGHAEGAEGAGEHAVPDTHNVLVKILGDRERALKTHCHRLKFIDLVQTLLTFLTIICIYL